jgi:hypothetical protein
LFTIIVVLTSATLLLSIVYVERTNAAAVSLKLPTKTVTLETFNDTSAYFITKLSNVPSGYSLTNKTYLGWCVDRTALMTYTPSTHQVQLYSSLNPPGILGNQSWDMVNYILNHKQGDKIDIQNALWYFINLNDTYHYTDFGSQTAWALINDTIAHGKGFVPDSTQITAVICYPVRVFSTDTSVQVSIVEVTGDASTDGSSNPDGNSGSNGWPMGNVFLIAIVVIALFLGALAFLLRRRSRTANG